MPTSANLPKVVRPTTKGTRAGILCDFKAKASERKILFASDKEAKSAGEWAIEKYHETFKALAK